MSSLPSLSFASLLRRYRREAGLTQEALAEQALLSVKAISALERGDRRAPRKGTIDLLAEALGLSPAERTHLHQVARGQKPSASVSLRLLPAAREILLPLAGRRQEVALLERHLAGAGPPLLLVAGEPGIGKSRLLAEAAERAGAQGWTVLEGGCHRRSGQEPFTPLLTALEGSLRRTASAALRSQLEGCAWLARLLPELAETTLVPAPAWSLAPEQERRLMFAAVARYLANVTGPTGTLLVLDDLQWAGVDALDLLATLLRTPGEQPLRVVGAYRSTEVHPPDPLGSLLADLGAGGLADEIRLGPLAPEEAAGLLQSILEGHEGAGDALREQVLTRTGGVPFFLVSCARALQMGVTGDDLPWDVAQHLRQRIAALPQAAQELLGMAAVVGREAPAAFLLRLALQPEQATLSALEALNQARLLIEVGAETVQFAHDLIREVVLADLSATRRRVWHRRVAETLEQEPGVPSIERLAYHYAQAGLDATAVIFLEQAGDHAQALHANSEAEGYYRELVVRLEKLGRQVESGQAREKLARMLSAQTRYHEVLAVLEQAAAAYRASGDIEGEGRVTAHIGLTHVLRGSLVEGIARVHHLLEGALSQALSAQGLGYLYDALAQLFQHSTRYSEQLAAADRACAYAQQAQDTQLLARAKASYGLALAYLDRTVEAIPWLEAAVSLRHTSDLQNYAAKARVNTSQIENPQVFPEMLHLLALQAFLEGDWDQSLAHLELARSLLDQETNAWVLAQVLIGLGAVKLFRGQGEGAQDLMEAHRLSAHPFIEQWIVILLSEGELVCGDAPAASARLEPLLEEPSIFTDYVLIGMGWAALKSDPGKAAALIEQGITVARSSQSQRGLTDGLRIQALLALQQRQWPTAEQALEEALQVSRSMPFPYGEAKALYVYGLLHQAKGEPEAARERLEAALTMLNRLGERLYAEQVERALAEGRRP